MPDLAPCGHPWTDMKTEYLKKVKREMVLYKRIPRGWHQDIDARLWSSPKGRFQITALEIFEFEQQYTCAVCGSGPDMDTRHLSIDCSYDVGEVSPKFHQKQGNNFYTIQLCKGCRAMFLFDYLAMFIDTKGRLIKRGLGTDGILDVTHTDDH